jgi:putative transposase
MRYPASEKLEIIRIVEQSHLPAKKTLDQLGIARRTFYRWYDRYLEGGPEALEDRPSRPNRVWNRIGDDIQSQIIDMALEQSDLSPRELAVRFTDEKRYFVSEATVYRLLKAHDLITSPAFVVIKAADEFKDKTTRPNEMWQTDFTYFKIIGWGWVYLSTVLDDFSRYIIAWKLCTTMRPRMSPTRWTWRLRPQAATAQGCCTSQNCCRQRAVLHRQRTRRMDRRQRHEPCPRRSASSADPGQDRALASDAQEPHPAGELLPAGRPRTPDRSLRRVLQSPTPPREP